MGKVKTFRQLQNQDDSRFLEPILNADGSFFCCACLEDKNMADISSDPRYCKGCCAFLLNEVEVLTDTKRSLWIPQCQTRQDQNPAQEKLVTIHQDTHKTLEDRKVVGEQLCFADLLELAK